MQFDLPKWYDLHTHLRQDALVAPIVHSQLDMGCCGILAMPNTKPPVSKVLKSDAGDGWSIEGYLELIKAQGGDRFDDIIVPLYITKDTTPQMIEAGAKSGVLRACKYYPPHGTTGADFGYPFMEFLENGVFEALADNGVVLCIHGEEHHMDPAQYFGRTSNAEEHFYQERVPRLLEKYPSIQLACEHVTTKVAVDLVSNAGSTVAASITPQHLLYTVGHLLHGLKYHLYCLPLLKFEEDRSALRSAVIHPENTKFYAGTDSAAHTVKATPCGCAAGCFTGGIAPQLYVQAFEEAGLDIADVNNQQIFERFLVHNGANFYGLPKSQERFTLKKEPQDVQMLQTDDGPITPLPLGLEQKSLPWSLKL